jgi:hypothetical protein
VVEWHSPFRFKGLRDTSTEAGWETADGLVTYGDTSSEGIAGGDNIPSYSELGSLPRDPAALDAYLVRLVYPNSNAKPFQKDLAAFSVIDDMLQNYVLPPTLQAEVYQALAIIPIVTADSHVTAIDGQAGVAFVLPATPQSEKQEIILNASNYSFLARASWGSDSSLFETAVVRMVIVRAPGSTQPSLTPPTAVEMLAEQADRAVTWVSGPQQLALARSGTWILRKHDRLGHLRRLGAGQLRQRQTPGLFALGGVRQVNPVAHARRSELCAGQSLVLDRPVIILAQPARYAPATARGA